MNQLTINQVVIWGHKLHSHTYSYINYGFFKAFEHLGYKILWLDNDSDISVIDLNNTLFITEGLVDKKIPIIEECYYILHNCDMDKYRWKDINILILQVYTKECLRRNIKKLDNCIYYEAVSDHCEFPTIYMPWATELLPYEIDENIKNIEKNVLNKTSNSLNFVGMLTNEWLSVQLFCTFNNINFNPVGGFSDNNIDSIENQKLIQNSYIAPSIQTRCQVDKGYIPGRIFKHISYGKMGITNNITVAELFNGNIIYNDDILKTLELGM